MTREELLTAARKAKRDGPGWISSTSLEDDNLPERTALFISLASPDAVIDMAEELARLEGEVSDLRAHGRDLDRRLRYIGKIADWRQALAGDDEPAKASRPPRDGTGGMMIDKGTGGDDA